MIFYGKPDEISPWMSDGGEELHQHKAVCPYCRLPLHVKLMFEVQHARYGKNYVENYNKRKSLVVFCRKGIHQRIEWDLVPKIDYSKPINYNERIAGTWIYSCGKVAIKTPVNVKGSPSLIRVLYDRPLSFSNNIWLIIERLKKNEVDK